MSHVNVLKRYKEEKCIGNRTVFSEDEVLDILNFDKIKVEEINDIPLGMDSWRPFIKHITSAKLVKLLYNGETGLNERNTYWNRYYPISGVCPDGHCPKSSNEYPASMSNSSNNIFSLSCQKEKVLNAYNKTKVYVEKLFLKHFLFSYICEHRGYKDGAHIMFNAMCKFDITLSCSNSDRGIQQHLFQYYYFMTEMGYTWKEIIAAVKRYAHEDQTFISYSRKIQTAIPYNEEHNKKHGWYKKITTFTDEQLKLPINLFMDILIDRLFNVECIHAYPQENGVSKFEDGRRGYNAWLDINPKTGKIDICKK